MPVVNLPGSALLARLEALRLSVRQVRWGARLGGRFVVSRRGSSIEFADYLPYSPGDDIRSIDWKLYARLDRLFVKTYKEEVELTVELIVDATASMGLPTPQKFRRACELALCLASVGFAGRHHVRASWIAPGDRGGTVRAAEEVAQQARAAPRPSATPWFTHRADLTRLAQWMSRPAPAGAVTMRPWMQQTIPALRIRGGQALLISDWMCPLADAFEALHLLRRKHVEVKVIQVLSPQELEPARLFRGGVLIDSETGLTHELAYSASELTQAVLEHNERLARFCKRYGMPFAQARADEPLEEFVLKTLPSRGFLE